MIKIIRVGLLLLLTIFTSSVSHADPKTSCPAAFTNLDPETYKAAAQAAQDHGFLWKITKQGHASYLYGTIHLGKLDWMFPGPTIKQAVGASDTIALEMDILDPDIQARMKTSMEALQANAIPDALIKQIKQQAKTECVPYETIAGMTPEFQVMTLQLLQARRDNLEAAYAIDSVLSGWGHSLKKTVVSLETPEMQTNLLQMKSGQETIAFVKEGLDGLKSNRSRNMLKRISDVWVQSDYEDLNRYVEWCECQKTQSERKFMKRLLDDRNTNLADDINTLHKSGKRVFAAVGSLHMVGQHGLPALMTLRGYKVEQVSFPSVVQNRLRLQEP